MSTTNGHRVKGPQTSSEIGGRGGTTGEELQESNAQAQPRSPCGLWFNLTPPVPSPQESECSPLRLLLGSFKHTPLSALRNAQTRGPGRVRGAPEPVPARPARPVLMQLPLTFPLLSRSQPPAAPGDLTTRPSPADRPCGTGTPTNRRGCRPRAAVRPSPLLRAGRLRPERGFAHPGRRVRGFQRRAALLSLPAGGHSACSVPSPHGRCPPGEARPAFPRPPCLPAVHFPLLGRFLKT